MNFVMLCAELERLQLINHKLMKENKDLQEKHKRICYPKRTVNELLATNERLRECIQKLQQRSNCNSGSESPMSGFETPRMEILHLQIPRSEELMAKLFKQAVTATKHHNDEGAANRVTEASSNPRASNRQS